MKRKPTDTTTQNVAHLAFRGRGLFAAVSWTAKARQYISADEYRYISPVFHFVCH